MPDLSGNRAPATPSTRIPFATPAHERSVTVIAARTEEPIPGYKVIQRIGAGGYGEVWTAQAPGDLLKAIKFVYGLLDEDRAARE